jgi:hypothetical protein
MDLPPRHERDELLALPLRAELFDALAALYRPATTQELAERVARHHNTVRIQLQRLAEGGLIERRVVAQCTNCTVTHNPVQHQRQRQRYQHGDRHAPVFVGGSNPTTWAGFALASLSPGWANASDGTSRGIVTTTEPPPEPTPTSTPTPTATPTATPTQTPDKPAAAVWTAPSGATVGTPVTLDGTRSTGDGTLTCTWGFEDESGSTVWETVTGCRITKTFQNADTKYVTLTVRDADGDTHSNRQSFAVTRR